MDCPRVRTSRISSTQIENRHGIALQTSSTWKAGGIGARSIDDQDRPGMKSSLESAGMVLSVNLAGKVRWNQWRYISRKAQE